MVPSIILGGKLASARHTEASPWSDLVDESEKLLRAEMDQIYPAVVDRKRGGFHQNFDANWIPIPDTDCMVVAQARHTWTAALLAEHWPDRHEQFEEIARHGIAFLSGPMSDSKEGVDGQLSSGRVGCDTMDIGGCVEGEGESVGVLLVILRVACFPVGTHAEEEPTFLGVRHGA